MSKVSKFWDQLKDLGPKPLSYKNIRIDTMQKNLVCFVRPDCPDSQDLAQKCVKFKEYHTLKNNLLPNLQLWLVDSYGDLGNEGQLLKWEDDQFKIYTDSEGIKMKFPEYSVTKLDEIYMNNGTYNIPQLVCSDVNNKITGLWYQHHEHKLRLSCNDPSCPECV